MKEKKEEKENTKSNFSFFSVQKNASSPLLSFINLSSDIMSMMLYFTEYLYHRHPFVQPCIHLHQRHQIDHQFHIVVVPPTYYPNVPT